MKEFVIELLKSNIPSYYYYHNHEHTLYVVARIIEIGTHEKCTEEEMTILKTAALWHDTGYLHSFQNHEEESCKLSRKYLPEYGYKYDQIDLICTLIMATKLPHFPKTKLEKIIIDADMEYLGTSLAASCSHNLHMELKALNPLLTDKEWRNKEISFLVNHQYFTSFCLLHREPVKKAYLKKLEKR